MIRSQEQLSAGKDDRMMQKNLCFAFPVSSLEMYPYFVWSALCCQTYVISHETDTRISVEYEKTILEESSSLQETLFQTLRRCFRISFLSRDLSSVCLVFETSCLVMLWVRSSMSSCHASSSAKHLLEEHFLSFSWKSKLHKEEAYNEGCS